MVVGKVVKLWIRGRSHLNGHLEAENDEEDDAIMDNMMTMMRRIVHR